MTFYERIYKTFSPIVKLLYRIEAVGTENIPQGGAIIAANHTSLSDPIVISAAAKRQVRYMAKKELFFFPLGPFIRALGAYPVDRGGADVGSIRKTIAMVEDGELIGIFPQGHRNGGKDPRTTEIKPGIGMIEYHSRSVVIPVLLSNKKMKTAMFRKNKVVFGEPITFEELAYTGGGNAEYLRASRMIFDRVCSLNYGALPAAEEPLKLREPAGAETDEPTDGESEKPTNGEGRT